MNSKIMHLLLALCVAGSLTSGCSRAAKKDRHLQSANGHFKAGDYDRAEIEYLNVLRLEQTNTVALRNLGFMSFEQGRLSRAYPLLSKVRKVSPEDLEVRAKLAQVLLSVGKPEEARDEAVQLLERQPTNETALMVLVDSSPYTTNSVNDLEDAQQRLVSLKSVSQQVPGYHVALATLQLRKGELPAAEASVRQAVFLDAKSYIAHGAMANLLAKKDPTNAMAEFKAAADLAPPRSIYHLRYVDFKIARGELADAKELISQITKQTPDYLPASLRVAQIALSETNYSDCDGVLKSILTRDPTYLEAMVLLARLHLAQNQPDKAVAALERAQKLFPFVPLIDYQLGVANLMQNDIAGATKSLNQALLKSSRRGHDYPEATLLLAQLNVRRGDPSQSISDLTQLRLRQPTNETVQLLLASAYSAASKPESALKIYRDLSRDFPTNPEPPFLMGLMEARMNKTNEARLSFENALTLDPEFLAAAEQLVYLDLAEKHSPAALQRAQAQVNRAPTKPAPYVLLARVHLAETNLASAETTLLKVLAFAPTNAPANALLARIYVLSTNKHQEALKKLNEMVVRKTNDFASWMQIAALHSAASDFAAAKEAYQKILAMNPRYVAALNNLAWLYAVRPDDLKELKRALELASKAHDLSPNNPSISDTFGWVLLRNGDYPRALAVLEESAKALPREGEVQFHLGMAHYMMGEKDSARVALRNAVQLAPGADWRSDADQRLRLLDLDPATADAKAAAELDTLSAQLPDDPILRLRQAAIAERDGNWDKAVAGYSNALKINTNLVTATVKLAQLLATRPNNSSKALELARRARDLSRTDPLISHALGQIAYAAGDFPWAASLLQESVRKLPEDPDVQFDFGLAAYSLGQVSNATNAVQAALSKGLKPPRSEQAKAFLRMQSLLGVPARADAASSEVQELLKQQPDYVPALMVMAGIQERKRDFTAAKVSYERILKAMPAFIPANRQLAFLYYESLKSPKEAYAHALKAGEASAQDPEVTRLLGILAYEREEFSRAGQLLLEAAALSPTDPEVIYRLGLTQYKLKQSKESKINLKKALDLAPNSPLAPEAKRLVAELK